MESKSGPSTTTGPGGVGSAANGEVTLLVGTRKGAFFFRSDASRETWSIEGPHLLGNIIHHLVLDPRDGQTMLMAARTGHLGPTLMRSTDRGQSWKEVRVPPAFKKAAEGEQGRSLSHVFWLRPGHPSEPNVWYAGTAPHGLFRSDDGGDTWQGIASFNDDLISFLKISPQDVPPGAATFSNILIDPRDARHMYIGLAGIGVIETTDHGQTWNPLNEGCHADWPLEDPAWGYDPHCVVLHPLYPDRLYQQNHCGIYRMDRTEGRWIRIGEAMPKEIGDIGFPIVVHPRDPNTAWVFPMDGTSVWPRTSPDGRPAVYVTRNAGESWERQDRGLPSRQAWFTVKRQCMATDTHDSVGVYFGTTSGEIWASRDAGESWSCIAMHLPEVLSVEVAGYVL